MRKVHIFFFAGLFLVTSGCSSKYAITYNSEPTGAAVICNGVNYGYTPKTLYWELSSDAKKKGYFSTQKCFAGWVSGAREYFSNTWDLNKWPDGVMQTLQRPNHPDYSKDAEFALKVRQMKAAENAAYQQRRAAAAAEQQNTQNNRSVDCYTVGAFTYCY